VPGKAARNRFANQNLKEALPHLAELEQENGDGGEPPTHQQGRVSTTDPDATYASKGCAVATLGYYDNYLVDNHSCVIVDVQATAAHLSQESVAAREMITRFAERRGRAPQTLAADNTYGNGELLHWLQERGIAPHIRVKESPLPKTDRYGIDKFTYVPETNRYACPEGKELTYVGVNPLNHTHVYAATPKRCRDCSQKAQCTRGRYRQIAIHIHEPARQHARELARTPAFAVSQRARKMAVARTTSSSPTNYLQLRPQPSVSQWLRPAKLWNWSPNRGRNRRWQSLTAPCALPCC